jgi:thiamine-monophosphate kinase
VRRETPLGPGAEFDVIRELLARWGEQAIGIGDDAAVLEVPRGESLVTSVDASFEGRHFRRGWLTPHEIGYRAVTAALSDLAAMAAKPLGVLIALALPTEWQGELGAIANGIAEATAAAGTVIRGGNISASNELSITTTVFGSAFTPLTRAGAKPGDRIYVTGKLGGPGAALRSLELEGDPGPFRERWVHPVARITEARWLLDRGASAAIDLSDGLVADLRHLAAASRVSIAIDSALVPCLDGIDREAALSSGEEYELIVAARGPLDTASFAARFDLPLTDIGSVGDGTKGHVTVAGARVANVTGHDHLSR